MCMKKLLSILLIWITWLTQLSAQQGTDDPTFNPNDNIVNLNLSALGSVVQSDGKIIVVGNFSGGILRYNPDGTIDNTFLSNLGTGFDAFAHCVTLQSDGKILVGGGFTSFNGVACGRIARLNANGTLDNSFNTGTGFDNTVRSIAVQNDGKILVGGSFTSYNSSTHNRIIRLNSNGSVDASFNVGTGSSGIVNSLAIQNDGKIIVVGAFTSFNSVAANRIIRLNSDGTIDNTFGTGFNSTVNVVRIQNDGKILVGGFFTSYQSTAYNRIIRLNADATIDATFSIGTGFNAAPNTIALQSDGKVLVGGTFSSYNSTTYSFIIRLESNGSIDTGFSIGTGFNNAVNFISLQNDGKLIVVGNFRQYQTHIRNFLVRLEANGNFDTSFTAPTGLNDWVYTLAIQNDGKILAGGAFTTHNGTLYNYIIRFNANGTVDNTFNIGAGFNNVVQFIALQNDGKILVGGDFTSYNGNPCNYIVRLNSDGTIDPSFNIGSGFNNQVRYIAIQNDGKILVGGAFSSYNSNTCSRIVRLNSNGSIDATFATGTGFNNTVYGMAIQNDGKILVTGLFTSYDGNSINRIIRLNSNGSIDTGFYNNVGGGFDNSTYYVALQNDGKIIVTGNFANYNGNNSNRIARLNADGTWDNTFNVGTGFNAYTYPVVIQNDGKIILGGAFISYNGNQYNRIIRLNSNGSIDNTFNIGSGFNQVARAIALQSDGKIVVGGNFFAYAGTVRNRITRLLNCPAVNISPSSLANATVGTSYNVTFTQTGFTGTITWSATGLPTGLNIDSNTGVLSGTPTQVGNFNITITATSNNGCNPFSQNYTLTVNCPNIAFVNTSASNATVGQAYTLDVSVTGNTSTISYAISPSLPPGLSLNASTGQITGIPTTSTPATTYTVTATQQGPCSATQDYTFAVELPNALTNNSHNFIIYPNPCQDKLVIQSNFEAEFEIYSIQGELLQKGKITQNPHSILLAKSVETGMYLLLIKHAKGVVSYKIHKF